jgi:hypothetical protein
VPPFDTKLKALALLPVAALSVTWTAALVGVGFGGSATGADGRAGLLPDGSTMPTHAIRPPASVSRPLGLSGADAHEAIASASITGIPAAALAAYQRAETVMNSADPDCHLPWQLVAAIGRVESDHGRYGGNRLGDDGVARPGIFGPPLTGRHHTQAVADTDGGTLDGDPKDDRAVGPLQFIPSTWSIVGVDADRDGKRNPQDIDDAALAAAVYLCSGREDLATEGGQRAAVFRYNHSRRYVDVVLSIMRAYMRGDFTSVPNGLAVGGTLGPALPPGVGPGHPPRHHHGKKHPTKTAGPKPTKKPTVRPTTPTPTAGPTSVLPSPVPTQVPTKVPVTPPTKLPSVLPTKLPTKLPTALPSTALPSVPLTSALPSLPPVLSLTQAIAKCTAEGKVDNPLESNDPFDQCVYAYTH